MPLALDLIGICVLVQPKEPLQRYMLSDVRLGPRLAEAEQMRAKL